MNLNGCNISPTRRLFYLPRYITYCWLCLINMLIMWKMARLCHAREGVSECILIWEIKSGKQLRILTIIVLDHFQYNLSRCGRNPSHPPCILFFTGAKIWLDFKRWGPSFETRALRAHRKMDNIVKNQQKLLFGKFVLFYFYWTRTNNINTQNPYMHK